MIPFELRQVRNAPDKTRPHTTVFLNHVVEIVPEEWGAKVYFSTGLTTEVSEEYHKLIHRVEVALAGANTL